MEERFGEIVAVVGNDFAKAPDDDVSSVVETDVAVVDRFVVVVVLVFPVVSVAEINPPYVKSKKRTHK